MNVFLRQIKTYEDVLSIKNNKEMQDKPFIFYKDNKDFYDCMVDGVSTSLGFRIAYFLWILRGANTIECLNYYSNHLKNKSDDDLTLRGAYGPRIRNWIGADQLQEAINKNMDVDDPEDFAKPKGIDQLNSVFKDLKGNIDISTVVIFNPALDFDNSLDIPDLISLTFAKENGSLHLNANYMNVEIDNNFVNDYFFISLLQHMMANVLQLKPGILNFNIARAKVLGLNMAAIPHRDEGEKLYPTDKSVEEMWGNIFLLYGLEKHLRCNVNADSILHPDVDVRFCCEELESQFIEKMTVPFWKELGYLLMIFALRRYDEKGKYSELEESLRKACVTSFVWEV